MKIFHGCRNGDKYAGEYFGDIIHGFGVYHFANGHCYEGSWHEGKKQGFGMYTFRNGEARCGDWASGVLKTPLPPSDPAVQHAVQVIACKLFCFLNSVLLMIFLLRRDNLNIVHVGCSEGSR